MTLYMKQKIFSWSDRFTVKDELGNDRYYVEGELFSWGDSYRIDIAGGTDEVLVLATVLAIDCVIEDSSSNH